MRVLDRNGAARDMRQEDILYFSNHQNTIYVHARQGIFVYPVTLSDLHAAYRDCGFDRLDRSNVVNFSSIERYDDDRRLVCFRAGSGYATVSEANRQKIKRFLAAKKAARPDE